MDALGEQVLGLFVHFIQERVKSRQGNIIFYIILAAVVITLGFLRDFVFTHLNNQLSVAYYSEFHHTKYDYGLPSSLSFLSSFDYAALNTLKWVLSGLFALLYFMITVAGIRRIYPGARHSVAIIAGAYVLLIGLAGLFYLYGSLSGNWKSAYSLSLTFSHLAQSPIVLMVLIPAFRLAQMRVKQS